MKKSLGITVVFVFLASISVTLRHGLAQSHALSPLTAETGYSANRENSPGESLDAPTPDAAPSPVAAALYGTSGSHLYRIDKTTGIATEIGYHGDVGATIGALAFDDNGILYGLSLSDGARLFTIDPSTGITAPIGPLYIGNVSEGGLAFGPSGQLYGANAGPSNAIQAFTINPGTGAAEVFGSGERRDLNGLESDGQTLYATDSVSNTVGTVDPGTGSYSTIGETGVDIGNVGGLAIDPLDGTLYATSSSGADDSFTLYTLNKGTGSATLIANNDSVANWGLAFAPPLSVYVPLIVR